MKKIKCHCGAELKNPFPAIVDLDKTPAEYDKILNGDFQVISCPECHVELKLEFPFQLVKPSENIDMYFIPELDRNKYFRNKLEYVLPSSRRIVIGYPELVEKIKILAGYKLDDLVIEGIKYYILSKILSQENEPESREKNDIRIYFREKDGDDLQYFIEGLKKDELGLFKINYAVYKKLEESLSDKLQQAPFSEFLNPPYISINRLFMENYDEE